MSGFDAFGKVAITATGLLATLAGCNTAASRDGNVQLESLRQTSASIVLAQKTASFPSIMLSQPPGWAVTRSSGDDTTVVYLDKPGGRLRLEYWTFESGACREPICRTERLQIGGRTVTLARHLDGKGFRTFIPVGPMNGNDLPMRGIDIVAQCDSLSSCDAALAIAMSIRLT